MTSDSSVAPKASADPVPAETEERQPSMAYPTGLNGQITDAVTQSLMTTTASAPSLALGQLYQTTAHALGLAAQNAVASQSDALALTQATLATLMHELTARRPRADAE